MDYKKLGFKCGIEIHQQLETHKLFCNCPSIVHDKNPDIRIERRLRAVVGETGEIDQAAAYEQSKAKKIIYEACSTSSCLVELDEEPPFPINPEAVEIGLQISMLLNAKVVDEIQVMRKTVVDGSNTTGFQRTALIAQDGFIETSKGKVRIPTICIEEEAAKKISEDSDSITYRLDRLGVALIEIATEADILDPEHAKETAEKLGMILRSTGKVKRGIGTIRQDVNVSISSHPRVEIKGFQDLRSIPKAIDNEIKRQSKEKKGESHVRKVEPDLSTSYLRPMPGAARMYPETDVIPFRISKKMLDSLEMPELIEEKIHKLEKKYNIDTKLASSIVKSSKLDFFAKQADKHNNLKPAFIINMITSYPKVDDTYFETVFHKMDKGEMSNNCATDYLTEVEEGKKPDIKNFLSADTSSLEDDIKQIIKEKPGLKVGAYMGLIMKKYQGKIDGKKAMQLLQKHIRE